MADAGRGWDGGFGDLPVCGPRYSQEFGNVAVSPHGGDWSCNEDHEFRIDESSATGLVASGDTGYGEPFALEIGFPPKPGWDMDLPAVGSTVAVRFCTCTVGAYARIATIGRELIWEGGNPGCNAVGDYPWAEWVATEKRLRLEQGPGGETCIWVRDRMTREEYLAACPIPATREALHVNVRSDQCDDLLEPGEDREIAIGTLRYLATAQGAFRLRGGSCEVDFDGDIGSAFIVRLER